MKKIIVSIFSAAVLLVTSTGMAQTKNKVEEIMVDGFKVIYKPTSNQIVSVRLFIKGGTSNYTKEQEGIENLMLDLITTSGTTKYPKSEYNRLLDKMGSTIGGSSGLDFGNIALNCVNRNFENSWAIFDEVINAPIFDEAEFKKQREAMVSNIQQEKSDPDAYLTEMATYPASLTTIYGYLVFSLLSISLSSC